MAFWTYGEDAISEEHEHTYEEYIVVIQGQYNLSINGNIIPLKAGYEYVIPKGTIHGGEAFAGTRAIYALEVTGLNARIKHNGIHQSQKA